jgi:hypothetical protein
VNDVSSDGYTGRENETTGTDPFNALTFLVKQIENGNWTITLGLVKSVTGGGIAAPPTVGVQPMVNQLDGQGQPTPHGIINNVPVFRLQGGSGAFIADPVVGDIGLLAFAMSDISAVKQTQAPANPGSFRTFDPADAMYFGALLSQAPTQYVQITPAGLSFVFGPGISITIGSSGIVLQAGSASIAVTTNGTVSINGLVWDVHTHAVTTAPGETGPPVL